MPMLLCVVLPTLLGAVYYFGIAAEQYVSESKFVVRGAGVSQPGALNTILQGAGLSKADEATYAVQDYILSRDALTELSQAVNIKALYARPEADLLSRFPMPYGGDTFEHLFKFYLKHVTVEYDSTTGVTQLLVQGFRPEDAQTIAKVLLQAGERLVNRMNERQRNNTLRDARSEVEAAEKRMKDISKNLVGFRNRESLLDPDKQSVVMLKVVSDLEAKLLQLNLQVSEMSKSSPQSPMIAVNQRRISVLQQQINDARSKITGSDQSMVPKLAEYDALMVDRSLADKRLISATTSLEAARMNFERQQLYLDNIVVPNLSDYATYPKRFVSVGIVFATFFALYTAAMLLISGAREHRSV